jgi:hypothetical protein
MRRRMPAPRPRSEVADMQYDHSPREKQAVRGETSRRGLRMMFDAARRPKALLLAAAAVFVCSACASLPPSSANANANAGANAGNAHACVGPVSYCNIYFGS